VSFNGGAGSAGKVSEVIGCFAQNGVSYPNANLNNPVLAWDNYSLNTLTATPPYDVTPPRLLCSPDPVASNLTLQWPATNGAFNLAWATNITSPTVWEISTAVPYFLSNQWWVTEPVRTGESRLYRLQQQ
jgi:hypothetical protein